MSESLQVLALEASTGVTVALVDDHELVRDGLVAWLAQSSPSITVMATAGSVAELRATSGWGADVVLLDVNLRDGSSLDDNVIALLSVGSKVLVVSEDDSSEVVRHTLAVGALGYVPKSVSAQEMADAVVEVSEGRISMSRALALALLRETPCVRPHLSRQERLTLELYAGGLPLKAVARRLDVGEGSVKSYVDRVREKYESVGRRAPTKVDLYRRAVEDGYLLGG